MCDPYHSVCTCIHVHFSIIHVFLHDVHVLHGLHVHVLRWIKCTVEPPNKGHAGTSHFVLCREVVLSLEVENVLVLWESEHLGPQDVSFIERLFLLCPLFGGSTIRGSTVCPYCCSVKFKKNSFPVIKQLSIIVVRISDY